MKLIQTSFFSAILTFVRISSGFVASKIVAVLAGQAGVALIGQFTSFIVIALAVANGAINVGVIKYTAEYGEDEVKLKQLFSTSLKITIGFSLVAALVLLLFSSYFSVLIFSTTIYKNVIRTFGFCTLLYALNTLFVSILNGKKQIKTYTLVNTAGSLTGLLLTVVLVYFFSVEGALYSLALTQSVVLFVTVGLITKNKWFSWSYFNQAFDKEVAKKLFSYSAMAFVTFATVPVAQIILRNMITEKLGIVATGNWQGMMRISDGYLLIVTTALSTYYLPKLSSLHTRDELRREIFQGYKIILPVVIVGCLLIYFCRTFIIHILYTSAFDRMESLFIYQFIGDFFKIASYILAFLMLAKSMAKTFIITEILFSASYVVFGYVFTFFFKEKGVTIAFALNYFIYLITMIIVFRDLLFRKNKDNIPVFRSE